MTDTLNKTSQSCTVSNTPETDAEKFYSDYHWCYVVSAEHAEDLERKRDEARFDLAFRRDLYKLQEDRADKLVAEVELWKENATSNRDVFDEMVRERDEAASACQIWQAGHSELVEDRNRWMSLAGVRREDYLQATTLVNELNKDLAALRKQNAKQLTLLQEHGLAEYGN